MKLLFRNDHDLGVDSSISIKAVTPENRIAPEHLFITLRIRTIELFEYVVNFPDATAGTISRQLLALPSSSFLGDWLSRCQRWE